MSFNIESPLIVILGPTASGKTNLAVQIADKFSGEIISADSRQIYRGMDIGTGKDLAEYKLNEKLISYHLIDILQPSQDYSVFHFQQDFKQIYEDVLEKKSLPILCGGTGLYIESILLNYDMAEVPPNHDLRNILERKSHEELIEKLKKLNLELHNTSDLSSKKRTIRAIEIGLSKESIKQKTENEHFRQFNFCVIGIAPERKIVRKRITDRLKLRLENGMIDEVEDLLKNGLPRERLDYFGLEYKFIGKFLNGDLNYNDMLQKLNTSIHQFSKRQMTFFRRMEKRGIQINWINEPNMKLTEPVLSNYFPG